MARVLKTKTTLAKQAAVAAGAVLIWIVVIVALCHHALTKRCTLVESGILLGTFVIGTSLSSYSLIYIRGYLGERYVLNVLRGLSDDYCVFNDITVHTGDKQAQIDHVVLSRHGLWCIETKSHLGMIFGKEKDQNWTQVKHSESGKRYKSKLYNPIRQNATHCRRLEDYLKERFDFSVPIRSVVVFTTAKLQVESQTPVVKLAGLKQAIVGGSLPIAISEDNLQRIACLLANPASSSPTIVIDLPDDHSHKGADA